MKDVTMLYGAAFAEEEIDALFTKADALDSVFESGKSPLWYQELRNRLCKIDKRFDYEAKDYREFGYSVFVFGINVKRMKDDETFGAFKKSVEDGIKAMFKKDIKCSFYTFMDED